MTQIYEPLFPPERITQEKSVITQEMSRNKENDNWRLGYLEFNNITPGRNPDIDERIANIAGITKSDLQRYHRTHYNPANTSFLLAGNYSSAEVRQVVEMVNQKLDELPAGKALEFAPERFSDYGGQVYTYEPYRQQQSLFSLRFTMSGLDEEARPALRIISAMLTSGLSARLQRKAREAGLTYGIGAGSSSSEDMTTFSIGSQTSLDKLQPLIELSCQELAAIGTGDFSDEELERAIGFVAGSIRRSHQTPASLAGWYVDDYVTGKDLMSPEQWVDMIEAVSRQHIAAAFRKYIRPANMTLTLVGQNLSSRRDDYRRLLAKYFA
jgi:zinc protease